MSIVESMVTSIEQYHPYGYILQQTTAVNKTFVHLGLEMGKGFSEQHSVAKEYLVTIIQKNKKGIGIARKILYPAHNASQEIDAVNSYALLLAEVAPIPEFPLASKINKSQELDFNLEEQYSLKLDEFFRLPNRSITHFRLDMTTIGERIMTSEGTNVEQSFSKVHYEMNVEVNNKELMVYGGASSPAEINLESLFIDAKETATIVGLATRVEPQSGPIVLEGLTTQQFFLQKRGGNPLITQTSAEAVYSSNCKVPLGMILCKDEKNLTIESKHNSSLGGRLVDSFGTPTRSIILIKDGVVNDYSGDLQYVTWVNKNKERFKKYVLDVTLTPGVLGHIHVKGGEYSTEELKSVENAVVIKTFSDLAMEHNGDISAEVRAGYVNRRGKKIPFCGNVLVGNLFDSLHGVKLSEDIMTLDNYTGPSTILFTQGLRLV